MAQKRELLEKLLIKLDEWAHEDGNEWFREKLHKQYGNFKINPLIEEKVISIEKYLALDCKKEIDYSAVENEAVRSQLERDCIEMYRYRYGVLRYEILFEECCRYAHMQSEELLNYFFSVRNNNDIIRIKNEIKAHNPTAMFKENTRFIGEINYTVKLFAVSSMNIIRDSYNEFNLLNKVRNRLSHRSSISKNENLEVEKYLKNRDFDFLFQSLENLKDSLLSNLNSIIEPKFKEIKNKSTFGDLPAFKNLKK